MRTRIAFVCLLVTLLPASSRTAQSSVDPATEADIRELLEVSGTAKSTQTLVTKMSSDMRRMLENTLPPGPKRNEILDTFFKKFAAKANSGDLARQMVPIYAKYLTHDDIKSLLEFYKSPAGQHFVKVAPEMMQEGYTVGSQWGQQIAQETMQEMQQKYPELNAPRSSSGSKKSN